MGITQSNPSALPAVIRKEPSFAQLFMEAPSVVDRFMQRIKTFHAAMMVVRDTMGSADKERFDAIEASVTVLVQTFLDVIRMDARYNFHQRYYSHVFTDEERESWGERLPRIKQLVESWGVEKQKTFFPRLLLYLNLRAIVDDVSSCAAAFDALVQSNFNDAVSLPLLRSAATFSLIDRQVVDTAGVRVEPAEELLINVLNYHLFKWRKLTDLPYVNSTNDKLALRSLRHVFVRAQEEHTIVSVQVSQQLLEHFSRQQYWFDGDPPCTAYVVVTTHGGVPVKQAGLSDLFGDNDDQLRAVKSTVPPGMAVTRLTLVPPGVITYKSAVSTQERLAFIYSVIKKGYDPLKMLLKLSDELYHIQQKYHADPAFREASASQRDALYIHNLSRPEAVMYVTGEKYLNKAYARSSQEGLQGWEVELVNTGEDLMDATNKLTLSDIVERCADKGYNHVCVVDLSCNNFQHPTSADTEPFSTASIVASSKHLVSKYRLGGGHTTRHELTVRRERV